MKIFLDTEFTDLSPGGELISVGAVTESGLEFYVELVPIAVEHCSQFVREIVLPLLEGGVATCSRNEFPSRFAEWLGHFEEPEILVDSDWDIYMLRKTICGTALRHPGALTIPGHEGDVSVTLARLPTFGGSIRDAFDVGQLQQHLRDPRQHHALADARAIAAGWFAAQSATHP